MIEKTKQLVESKYTLENGYDANAKVRARPPAAQGPCGHARPPPRVPGFLLWQLLG